jgi:LPXTG-motif cell wall-anchored protein
MVELREMRRMARRRNPIGEAVHRLNPLPKASTWLIVAGVAAIGGAAYFLSKKSSQTTTSQPAPNAPITTVTQFIPGTTYSFTAPLPPQLNAAAAITGLKPVLQALGWTNVAVTAITPGTYSVIATWSGPAPLALPQGVTANMV